MKKLQLSIPQATLLLTIYCQSNPRTEEERALIALNGAYIESFRTPEGEQLGTLNNLVEKGCIALQDDMYVTTKLGANYAVSIKSMTPDFSRLASSDISTAIAMILRGYEALKVHIGDRKIVAGRDSSLVDALRSLRDWIDNKIGTEQSVVTAVKRPRKTAPPKVEVNSFTEIANNDTGESEDAIVQHELEQA